MEKHKKRILIVDDSDIDREILKNILQEDFNVCEAANGYAAIEILVTRNPTIDMVLLDISMPYMDGFQVLRLMKENNINDVSVILISAEATKDNVEKASQFDITDFIKKPYDHARILEKVCEVLNVEKSDAVPVSKDISNEVLKATNAYIKKLSVVYSAYMLNHGKDYDHYLRLRDLMVIVLDEYASKTKNEELDYTRIELIAEAAQFHDLGKMTVPDDILNKAVDGKFDDPDEEEINHNHTVMGANIVWLNEQPLCRYFVEICGDMCMHHHERHDGTGFPHRLKGTENSIYTRFCRLLSKFDKLFYRLTEYDSSRFDVILDELLMDRGSIDPALAATLRSCKSEILGYYKKLVIE
ncbi:MAG: two-component system response regulator [Oscillospiraceae bacterium]